MKVSRSVREIGIAAVTAAVVAAGFWATTPVTGQAARPARMADGKPNLNGIWQALNTANYDVLSHSAKAALAFQPGPVVPVPAAPVLAFGAVGAVPGGVGIVEGDEIPYLPEAAKKQKENQEDWLNRDPEIKCYLPGVPRANYLPHPFQILHSDKAIFFAYEFAGAVRNIYLKDPGEAPVDSWMGQSVGKWEGDTLVVTVTGLNDQTWFDRAGNHHSEQMKVVERYTPQGPDHLWYEATIEDPATFSRPWKIRMPLYRHINPNARLNQFKCVEFVEELMYGKFRKTAVQ
ncbi:MAG: hypothetical protein Q8T13_16285 [Acidobacteriota bacterium]|nr:hypothetical protein [Acidobacteriota bacterium]